MSLPLPDLLVALAGIFAGPEPLAKETLRAATQAFWISAPLKRELEDLLASDTTNLAVTYADHFLVSRAHPLLYLEASVHRTGLLRDPALLQDLDHHYAAFDFDVPQGLAPDHLATELAALATGLQRLGGTNDEELGRIVPNLLGLIDLHLLPLLSELNALAGQWPVQPMYAAALRSAQACVDLSRDGVFAFN